MMPHPERNFRSDQNPWRPKNWEELVDFFNRINFTEEQFRGTETIRLKQLKYLHQNKFLDETFRVIINN